MKRKDFISALVPGAVSIRAIAQDLEETARNPTIPPYLGKGDTIGITSPAGYITLEDIQPALIKIKEWGFNVSVGSTIGKRSFTFGGTDEERAADLQQMLDDKDIKAILCARGGYGVVRLIDRLDFKKFIKRPKWVIGFSDITVMHSHINRNYNIASLHSKMCNSFPPTPAVIGSSQPEPIQIESIESIRQCLSGEKMVYHALSNANNKPGKVTGTLVGGNLKTLESLAGSCSDIVTKNKILFVEDTGEYLYSIDRMFWNLKRTGKLSQLNGLIVGGFKIKKDDEDDEFGKSLEEIILEKITEYKYPVCFDFPVGHQKNNFALKCGMLHQLEVTTEKSILQEQR
jgi:muramoyltetrapeptide carboxypeptidase